MDKPDVAALTDEQCDAIIGRLFLVMPLPVDPPTVSAWERALIRAGRASLQANVPAVEHTNQCENWMTPRPGQGWRTCICGADDKPEVAALQRENAGLLGRCGLAEARVTHYEARVAELETQIAKIKAGAGGDYSDIVSDGGMDPRKP